ncbi:MAG: hypothetical protein HY074_04445 [Deltaproteobacteria bacterium]|nr:hypothetical protein [Deltaproteobacteria bacterium]
MRASASNFKVIRTGNPLLLVLLVPVLLVLAVCFGVFMLASSLLGGRRRVAVGRGATDNRVTAQKESAAGQPQTLEAEFHHVPN